ncbi:MAG: UDP-N-acetylmuramate--L-alanine ligase [Spirochaetales bacterium]|nr:UDP-N-acetylmuramate--L-alanine ligase [Spirochaetales bacterium]
MSDSPKIPEDIKGLHFYFIGIKGTGMTALAELYTSRGARVSGADVDEVFYTDRILANLPVTVYQGFAPENLDRAGQIDYAVRSSAYGDDHPEVKTVLDRNIPLFNYTEALGELSRLYSSTGIAGVHGKTTTTGLTGTLLKELDMPASVLVGSGVSSFGGRSTWNGGDRFFVAETCEYQRHFLDFYPRRIVLTSVEPDHLDYFSGYVDILSAFMEYIDKLPEGGELIYCADDTGAVEAAQRSSLERPDLKLVPYGETAEGPFRIVESRLEEGKNIFRLAGWERDFVLPLPGKYLQLNAAAALAVVFSLLEEEGRDVDENCLDSLVEGVKNFRGSKRRCELVGEKSGVLIMDDYGHHPTAIDLTLRGLKEFYPNRRLIVDFMSHTYSRTAALLDKFAASFTAADVVILHEIYASAREKYDGTVTGETLFEEAHKHHDNVYYFQKPSDAQPFLRDYLRSGDLFVTMGAGDNWQLGLKILETL